MPDPVRMGATIDENRSFFYEIEEILRGFVRFLGLGLRERAA